MSYFEILAAVVVVAAIIARQLRGEALTGRRLMVLPVVLIVIGLGLLRDDHPASADIACLAVGGLLVAAIGAVQGAMTRLEPRAGVTWARTPAAGLWLWALLVVTRLAMTVVAHAMDAKVAASSASIFLALGVNRLGQAAVLVPRLMSSGMEFAPERDGRTFPDQIAQRFSPPPLDNRPPGAVPEAGQPGPGAGQPMPGSGQPVPGTGQPVPGFGQPMPGAGQPAPGPRYQQGDALDALDALRNRRQLRRARRYGGGR
ncbi:hypothetical protein [Streptomyces sp. TS71-3]|uniref:hypothetical protein n=1 Tax=Streptomyces sp. TS71-3 TaxID=2733862 RepID=UPI001B17F33C|nr:hypothetical protein [Streptomyces sp. TS71-3]GHJ37149.1 hypothetical protein Sm713_27580 [Streptomyces sp. TS71-3]